MLQVRQVRFQGVQGEGKEKMRLGLTILDEVGDLMDVVTGLGLPDVSQRSRIGNDLVYVVI